MIKLNDPAWFNALTAPLAVTAWAEFYTSSSSPSTVSYTVRLTVGAEMLFDFGDGTPVVLVTGTGSNQVVSHLYSAPGAGYKNSIYLPVDMTALSYFYCQNNQFTGSFPSLAGLTSLYSFYCYINQLTGSIPPLGELPVLTYLLCFDNQLTGTIPSLGGTDLQFIYFQNNQFSDFSGQWVSTVWNINTNLSGNSFTESGVNNVLIAANTVVPARDTGDTINLTGGTSAAPTGAGIVAFNELDARGVNVSTN